MRGRPVRHDLLSDRAGLSRRRLLQVGALGLGGLSLPELWAAEAQAGREATVAPQVSGRARRPSSGGGKSCIVIYQYGGLSQLDSWDPKPHAPAEQRGPYRPIATATPGFQVGELMPELARRSERYCVVRSLTHQVPVHDVANRMLLAGGSLPPADAPAFGSVVSKLRPAEQAVPSYVWLQKFGGGAAPPEPSYTTGGFLGQAHGPLVIGTGHDDNPATPGYRIQAFDLAESLSAARLAQRQRMLTQFERQFAASTDSTAWDSLRQRAYDLVSGGAARQACDLTQEADAVRDRYGRNPLGQNLLLARRLIEAGTRLVGVVAWTGLAPGEKFLSVETWDMHGNAGISIFDNGWNGLGWALPRFDQAVAALLDDLSDRGLLDSTLVVAVGEFGRTPRISRGAKATGRDHWPHCYSGLLAGAGLPGGAVYGASDAAAAYVKDRPVSLEDLTATLYRALDIDPATRLSPDGFTRPASSGTPIAALLG